MKTLVEHRCFGGTQGVYSHQSECCRCEMTFGLFLPDAAKDGRVPSLWFLSGLTCTHENAMIKTGAQYWASRHGMALVFPDTSPRGEDVADHSDYDLGQGAGFYVNATETPWSGHFRMWDYVSEELPALLADRFPLDPGSQGITGHSMGGHGALTIGMTFPDRFRSLSAFAPIANPTQSDWGRKQFKAYLGGNEDAWKAHDASHLVARHGYPGKILIDQGSKDPFIDLLCPKALETALAASRQEAGFHHRSGYDHSYFFVMSFIPGHIQHHAAALKGS
ncbi:MAG: S-formylglutathione hydrolase [Rhodobacteraceae bacterium]|nr:S-formylglutathione hydrolase [Paracoccaceae bacterium]